jgi:hypothetical protein
MGFVQGEGRTQGTLFPVCLEELVPDDHLCRVIDAFVDKLDMPGLGFERAEAAETGRPGYDPRDLLKLYLYGYLQQIRSSRRLESECRRNVELMWLLGRLVPDSGRRACAAHQRGGRCGLLEWRAGRSARSERNSAACAGQPWREQSRRWHAVQPHRICLST